MASDIWYGVVFVEHATEGEEGALLCQYEGETAWVPKSLIVRDESAVHDVEHIDEEGELVIPLWKAEELGWA